MVTLAVEPMGRALENPRALPARAYGRKFISSAQPRSRNSDEPWCPCRPRPAYISRHSRFIGRSTALLVRWHPG